MEHGCVHAAAAAAQAPITCGMEMLQSGLPCVHRQKALPLTLLSSWPDAFDGDSHPLTSVLPPQPERDT